jgi:hypothetical protein
MNWGATGGMSFCKPAVGDHTPLSEGFHHNLFSLSVIDNSNLYFEFSFGYSCPKYRKPTVE